MAQPRTPTGNGVSLKREGSKGPRTPSANRLASQQQQARLERGETAAASAPFAQSTRAWRTGGDRKIMFENRAGHALIPEARRPVSLVAMLNICAWLLVATGLFQVVISKLSKFQWPLHWVGVLMMFLGLMSMGVRVFTNRCGTSPTWVGAVAVVTIVACLTAWLVADGPLYDEVKSAQNCVDQAVPEEGDTFTEDSVPAFCLGYDCLCETESSDTPLCVHFRGSCEYVSSNRRYLVMSLFSSWVGIGLSFLVAVMSVKVSLDTYDPGAVVKAEEKKKMKEKKVAVAGDPPAVPFGV